MKPSRLDELRLQDPLSKVTRAERRNLLGVSALGIVVVKTGLVPSRIVALGIEFTQADQRSLLTAVAAIVTYFLVAFLVYATADFLAWRVAFQRALLDIAWEETRKLNQDRAEVLRKISALGVNKFTTIWFTISKPASLIRGLFEFALPLIVGFYSIVLLLKR